jgi:predicted regulator of Ras-like GTPase activity (Roadblock/LC7/MglB family)
MKIPMSRRLFLPAAVLGGVAVFAAVFFLALAVRSVVAGPDAGPAAAPPNPGHSWSQIGDLPGTMWHSNNDGAGSGLDADTVDGLDSSGFAGASHDHDDRYYTETELQTSGSASVHWGNLTSKPAGFADDIDDDVLGGLSCANGEIAKWDGSAWQCAADQTGAGTLNRPGFARIAVDSGGYVGGHTSVTVGTDGLPLISYYDSTNGDLKVAHCGNAACTSSTTTTVDSGGGVGWETSLTVGADGLPVISYYDVSNADLKVAHCGNAACSAGNTIFTFVSADTVGRYTSVTVGADGLPVISYCHMTNAELRVAHCGNAACNGGNTITTVDSGYVGAHTSVTVGADGLAVISYYDVINNDLKVAHCGNAACNGGNTITTVDSGGNVGSYTSVTVGADGLPLISYYDLDNGDLKVAHCGNAACTSSITTTVDYGGDVGQYTSLTVGADGQPVISYHDVTNGDLKVAHCSNRFCVPYHRPR